MINYLFFLDYIIKNIFSKTDHCLIYITEWQSESKSRKEEHYFEEIKKDFEGIKKEQKVTEENKKVWGEDKGTGLRRVQYHT
jgi:hypothetical protein